MPHPPIDAAEIIKTETRAEVTFPPVFKQFMMKSNGGTVEADGEIWVLVPFHDATTSERRRATAIDILQETKSARKWDDFPPDGFVIAMGEEGDCLVLLPSEEGGDVLEDVIYAWESESGELVELGDSITQLED